MQMRGDERGWEGMGGWEDGRMGGDKATVEDRYEKCDRKCLERAVPNVTPPVVPLKKSMRRGAIV